jgi:probable enterotoxin B
LNRKRILQLLLATSAIASTIGFTNQYVHATEQTQVQTTQVNSVSYHNIMGSSEASKEQMINYFKSLKISDYRLSVSIENFVNIAYEEAQSEGVRGDIVVAQAFLETGYFRYNDGKGIVTAEDNNFAGIGAVGTDQSRNKFKDVREGLRAQVQHLKAYASTEPLKNAKVDPRFQLVTRGSAKSLEELGGKWAYPGYDTTVYSSFEQALSSGNTYGQRIYSIIGRAIGTNNEVKNSTNITEIKQAGSEKGQVVNVSTNLRMRQSASADSPVISYLNNGQTFDIKGIVGDWYYISISGKLGYIHKDYVKETPSTTVVVLPPATSNNTQVVNQAPAGQSTTTQAKGQVTNVSTSLRIRQLGNIGSAVIGYLNNGQTFDIKEKSGDWYYIKFNDKFGYVHKDYVKEISSTTETNTPANNNQNTNNNTNQPNTNQQNNQPTNTNTVVKPSKGQVIDISTTLRIRQNANTSSAIIGYLNNGQTVDIKDVSGDWYYIQAANRTGYVSKQYIKVTESSNSTTGQKPPDSQNAPVVQQPTTQVPTTQQPQTPQVTVQTGMVYNVTTNLRLRSKASSDSSVVAYILPNQTFKILGSSGDWFNIDFNGKIGYVSKAYVKVVSTSTSGSENTTNAFQEVYNVLKTQIGTPYIYGGYGQEITSSLIDLLKKAFPSQAASGMYDNVPGQFINKGYKAFDCSGLMQWGFKQAGISIGRTTYDQINDGKEVSKDEVKPGDLLFYSDISHVGMYVGDGKWIEAPNSKSFVRVVDVPWNKIGRVRRVIN